MKVTHVSNAAFIISIGNVKVLTDPWLKGSGFINGWNLLYKSDDKKYFKDIDFIWFSHEHPDHFSPQSLNYLSEIWESMPTVLFQKTRDQRLVKFIKKYGGDVIELESESIHHLTDSESIKITGCGVYDSFATIKNKDFSFTHLNDCNIYDQYRLKKVKSYCDSKVNVVTSQYGLSAAPCSSTNVNMARDAANIKANKFKSQISIIAPDYYIPSSSSIHFSSFDNCWMNRFRLNPIDVIDVELPGTGMLAMPGDEIDFSRIDNENFDAENKKVAAFFAKRLSETESLIINKSDELIEIDQMRQSVVVRSREIRKLNNFFVLVVCRYFLKVLKPIVYYIDDHKKFVKVDILKGTFEVLSSKPSDYVSLYSYALNELYHSQYGVDALLASARLDLHGNYSTSTMNNHLNIQTLNLSGLFLRFNIFFDAYSIKKLYGIFNQWIRYVWETWRLKNG
jgi:UDP-MurNAc hydroxylase